MFLRLELEGQKWICGSPERIRTEKHDLVPQAHWFVVKIISIKKDIFEALFINMTDVSVHEIIHKSCFWGQKERRDFVVHMSTLYFFVHFGEIEWSLTKKSTFAVHLCYWVIAREKFVSNNRFQGNKGNRCRATVMTVICPTPDEQRKGGHFYSCAKASLHSTK